MIAQPETRFVMLIDDEPAQKPSNFCIIAARGDGWCGWRCGNRDCDAGHARRDAIVSNPAGSMGCRAMPVR
jgi:hypothetical protein